MNQTTHILPCLDLPGNKEWTPTDSKTINLPEPLRVTFNNVELSWSPVPGAVGYKIYIGSLSEFYERKRVRST
jgi:hypothetical protein